MAKLDCSMIRNVRVPHQQFEAIKNKAKYLMVEDRDSGEIISFVRENDDNTSLSDKPNYKEINEFVASVNERIVRGMI